MGETSMDQFGSFKLNIEKLHYPIEFVYIVDW